MSDRPAYAGSIRSLQTYSRIFNCGDFDRKAARILAKAVTKNPLATRNEPAGMSYDVFVNKRAIEQIVTSQEAGRMIETCNDLSDSEAIWCCMEEIRVIVRGSSTRLRRPYGPRFFEAMGTAATKRLAT